MNKPGILKCPYCGAGEVVKKKDNSYECNYCSTVFRLPKEGIDLEMEERPVFTCGSCGKELYAEDWQQFTNNSLQSSKTPVAKKVAVNFQVFHCQHCHDFVCLKCVKKGRFKKYTCQKCGNKLEVIPGSFVVSDLKEVPGMFKQFFVRQRRKG